MTASVASPPAGDQFAVLPTAVAEGRRIVDGMVGSASPLLTRTYTPLIVLVIDSLLAFVTVGVPSPVVIVWARSEYRSGTESTGSSDAASSAQHRG